MPLMSTCVARLGSRYSIILDPIRKEIQYGSLGLMCQKKAEMVVGLDDGKGKFTALPLGKKGKPFDLVDQQQTMTSVSYEAHSLAHGVKMTMEVLAPFWPQDEKTSTVPAYLVTIRVSHSEGIRWTRPDESAKRKGVVRFGIAMPGAKVSARAKGGLRLDYAVVAGKRRKFDPSDPRARKTTRDGKSTDLLLPLAGAWKAKKGALEVAFDVSREGASQEFRLALIGYMGDALLERFGEPMALKYASAWKSAEDVAAFVKAHEAELVRKSAIFDALFSESALPAAAQDLTAHAFRSYLMCTLWAGRAGADWFSVWEGSCAFNSTVDVTYNEAPFYFACWPELMEKVFEEWSHHANDAKAEHARRLVAERNVPGFGSDTTAQEIPFEDFAGVILEHDMGAGWTVNGQSYHHPMPVEENANWLLLLYAHGVWWGREELFARYRALNADLAEYLLWSDSTGNGFPDRGVANTIDDATPAVQYGRDNVYLGVKRLAALHAASRMLDAAGDARLAARCRKAVKVAVKTLNAGWLGDHWGVCLDKSAEGLFDAWTGRPLPYKVLPGWDALSLYTTNGLFFLLMIDDLPPGLDRAKLSLDLATALEMTRTPWGCSHSSTDKEHVWISMNVWRDAAASYLGGNLLAECDRYWNAQLRGNAAGSEKANCFDETPIGNNLVWYPRGAACFALLLAGAGLVKRGATKAAVKPIAPGRWPLLSLADWKAERVPFAIG